MTKKAHICFRPLSVWCVLLLLPLLIGPAASAADQPIIVDHTCTDITEIPESAINAAKALLHIGYGHTSHGSQLTSGMSGLVGFANNGGLGLALPEDIFRWNNGGAGGALDLEEGDGYGSGWLDHDCGYYPNWVNETRLYLDDPSHADVNVIIWSWCGQASGHTEQSMLDTYLDPMDQLEDEYPDVTFVYMTGHADGTGETGNLHLRNQQIRDYCIDNNKVLYDYYDIECYDPDGSYFGDKLVNDGCYYDTDGNGSRDGNWAIEWQDTHTQGVDWYSCSSAHSQPLNANRKAYAAWWLWARLGGWGACLPAPSGLAATPDSENGQISLNWTDNASAPNENSFIIQRQVDGGAWDNDHASVPADTTSFVESDLASGTYHYRVVAHLDDDGTGSPCNSGPSNVAAAELVSTEPPTAPSDLSATADSQNRTISLAWTDQSENETGFIIQRQVDGGAWDEEYATVAANETAYQDRALDPGLYNYRVAAHNTYGQSDPSNESETEILDIPLAPANLGALGDSLAGTVSLTWTDHSDSETGFIIKRQMDGGAWDDSYDTVGEDVTYYLDNNKGEGPLANGTYNYRVLAYNANGNSAPSNEASAVISSEPPAAPSELSSDLNGFDITLQWTDNSDNEESFIVERKVDSSNFSVLETLQGNVETYTDEGLTPLHTYTYRVKAHNNYGDSDYSNETWEYMAEEEYTITLKQGVDEYAGCKDAYLDSASPDTNYGNTPYKHVLNNPKCNFVISFDLPPEVMDQKILEATIGFYCWTVSGWDTDQYLDLFRVTEAWEEEGTTWHMRTSGNNWTTAGGTHDPEPLDYCLIPNQSFYPEFDITPLVQTWVDGTQDNHGVLMKNDSIVNTGIKASEYSEYGRPYLEITYTSKPACVTDSDEDGDVDGVDLAAFAADFQENCLAAFADAFGE